jgi:IrrE N-terminal-like domain
VSRRRSRDELKALVCWLRGYLGIENVDCPDMLSVLSKAQQLFPGFSYRRVRDDELPDGKEAAHEAGELRIADKTFRALERGEPRARFTVAHELAHFVLQHPEVRFRGAQLRAYETAKRSVRVDEAEANEFAALFLAPDTLIQETDTVADVAGRLGLSPPAAEIRKAEFDADARRRRGELRPVPGKVIDFLERQQKQGYTVKTLESMRRQSADAGRRISMQPPAQERRAVIMHGPEASTCVDCGNPTVIRKGNSFVCQLCGYSSDPD